MAPTAAIIDSQSVKTPDQAGESGYDAGKKIKGRKRHLAVDTLGLVLAMMITSAAVQDRDAAKTLLGTLGGPVWAAANHLGRRRLPRRAGTVGQTAAALWQAALGNCAPVRPVRGLQSSAQTMDHGTNLWLADQIAAALPGL